MIIDSVSYVRYCILSKSLSFMCQKFMRDMCTVHLMSGESLQNRTLEHLEMDAQA